MKGWDADALLTEVHSLLYALGVKATTQGFFETSCAVFLVTLQSDSGWFSIMEVYQKISALYRTELGEVEPRIRGVIAKIWRKQNRKRLNALAGQELAKRPSPRQFIEIMRRYLVKRKYHTERSLRKRGSRNV